MHIKQGTMSKLNNIFGGVIHIDLWTSVVKFKQFWFNLKQIVWNYILVVSNLQTFIASIASYTDSHLILSCTKHFYHEPSWLILRSLNHRQFTCIPKERIFLLYQASLWSFTLWGKSQSNVFRHSTLKITTPFCSSISRGSIWTAN